MESVSLQRIYERLTNYRKSKEDIQEKSNSMLFNLVNNTGQLDSFLVPHNKEFCSCKKIWKRLPVNIDRTIINVFKTLTYDLKSNADLYSELRNIINRNVLSISTENENYNEMFRPSNLQQELQQPGTIGIYDEDGTLIDVADINEYYEYLEEYQNEAKQDYLKKYLDYKRILGTSFIDLLLKKQIEKVETFENTYPKNISKEQKRYILQEMKKENTFWKRFYNKKRIHYRCKICGEPIYNNSYYEYHVCDVPLKHSKLRNCFENLNYIHFYENFELQKLNDDIITVSDNISLQKEDIPEYKKEILKMNDITSDFDIFNQFRIRE